MSGSKVISYLLLAALVAISSGCMGLGGGEEADTLVEEGTILSYETGESQTGFVFFNETESTIHLTGIDESDESVEIRKSNWTTTEGTEEVFFLLSGLFAEAEKGKIKTLMEEGRPVSITTDSTWNLSRSERFQWGEHQAYNVTARGQDHEGVFTVHAKEPYLILSSSIEGLEFELANANHTENPGSYFEQGSEEENRRSSENRGMQKAQNTDIEITPIYAQNDQMMATITNTGVRTINTSKFSVYYATPDFPEPVRYSVLPENWKTGSQECLTGNQLLEPGERLTCGTGLKFPDYGEETQVRVLADNYDYSTEVSCIPETSESRTC